MTPSATPLTPSKTPATAFAGDRSPSSPSNERYWDDSTRCNVCEKKFKLFSRHRHYCARCLSAFCHKHGRTTHSNMTSCRVPGSCVCDRCLALERFHREQQEVR
jgi:hypothetical protein